MTISQFPLPEGGIPTGDTAGRPANPVIGDVYYNGELGILEIFDGTNFIACSAPPAPPTVTSATDVGTNIPYASAQVTVVLADGTGGGLVSAYKAVGIIGGTEYISVASTSSTVTLNVGTNGTYAISGQTANNFGTSISGPSTSVALTTVPQAPTIGTASTSSTTSDVTITWTLNNNGGKNLSSITITPYLNGTTAQTSQTAATTSSTTHAFTGLTMGSAYTFKVKTANANGTSLESSATSSITVPTLITTDFLVIAGGGGGGGAIGGGGGAGGYRTSAGTSGGNSSAEASLGALVGTNITVTVGAGGTGATSTANYGNDNATKGSNSVYSIITSEGGGRAGRYSDIPGQNGGSGAGGAGTTGGTGTANQGSNGGNATSTVNGGGGGGASAAGANAAGNNGGNGGDGLASDITGSSVTRAGGGGGGVYQNRTAGTGGTGGGGNAGTGNGNNSGNAGTVNTGGGGGGGSCTTTSSTLTGGNGGSGVVIIRYPDTRTITIGAGLTGTESAASGGFKRATITAGSGNVSWA